MSRTPFVAGNWKMHKTIPEAEAWVRAMLPRLDGAGDVEAGVCVPAIALATLIDDLRGSPLGLYAQTMHEAASGAYTGEVSAPMLAEIGIDGVLLGHSERRALFGETDRALALKVPAALEAGLRPILCVGETEEERERGGTERKLRSQVQEGLREVAPQRLPEVVIAYEPVWAIGTGRAASAEQAGEAMGFVRALVADRDAAAADTVRILYGGSVKPGPGLDELLAQPDVDGFLVGGASLDPDSFAAIVAAARP